MPPLEKAKWVLADDPLEAMELYFKSLGFQDMAQFYGMKNMGGLKQHRDFKSWYPIEAAEKIQKTRKILAKQLGIGEYLTRKQWYWAMGLDDIPNPPEWPVESWPLVRPFWHKNDLGARLDAWAKCDPLLLDERNPLRDSEASDYWKRHDPMKLYSSNPRNIQRKKRIQTLLAQAPPRISATPPTIQPQQSTSRNLQDDLIHHQLQSELLNAQKTCHTVDASPSHFTPTNSVSLPKTDKNISQQPVSSSFPLKRKRTQTIRGQALEEEKELKQAKINARKEKQSMKSNHAYSSLYCTKKRSSIQTRRKKRMK